MKKAISIFTLMLLVSTAGFAQDNVKSEAANQNSEQKETVSTLDLILTLKSLSPDERKIMEGQVEKEEQVSKPILEKLSMMTKQIEQGKKAANPDVKAVSDLIDEKHKLEATLEKNQLGFDAKILRLLSEEQFSELEEKRAGRN